MAWPLLIQFYQQRSLEAPDNGSETKLKNLMSTSKIAHQKHQLEIFKPVAVEFTPQNDPRVELALSKAGLGLAGLPAISRREGFRAKPVRAFSGLARLRAENEALRHQLVDLHVQWEMLKTTLGELSASVYSHESI